MLYLIGLGLNEKGISKEGLEVIGKCKRIYLENYTVEFPYSVKELEKVVGKKIVELDRGNVESDKIVDEAKKGGVCLLIYGSPLFATTHMSLIMDCRKARVKTKIIYSTSIFDALGETGLQLYKFGKISSMPKWEEHFKPNSFLNFVIQNKKINAHSLILIDIGLNFKDALEQLEEACKIKKIEIDKLVVCSKIGTSRSKILYGGIDNLKVKKIEGPFCLIIPEKMHFMEKESVERFGQ